MGENIIKLFIILLVVAVTILGLHYLGSQIDNQNKYKHPITREGAHW